MNEKGEDGYELWLRYRKVDDAERLAQYRDAINSVVVLGASVTAAIIKTELARALPALLDRAVPISENPVGNALVVGTLEELKAIGATIPQDEYRELGAEGFLIRSQPSVIASRTFASLSVNSAAKQSPSGLGTPALHQTHDSATLCRASHGVNDALSGASVASQSEAPLAGKSLATLAPHASAGVTPGQSSDNWILITANSAPAVLTGTFHFLRLLQMYQDIRALDLSSRPRIRHRILAHWDNLDGSIERGYAGRSLWNWDVLPKQIDARYHDYARACASIGINGTCLNNVNANAKSLTTKYLEKTAALADVFRPYGIRVYLSPNFSAPIRLGGLDTSDPRDPAVAAWWKQKVDEIYRLIPDFGGFQVKANSEGEPGPQDYGANHDDGTNMLAEALKPHGGIVLWRAFVYDTAIDADRAKCAYKEFVPLDGKFQPNVFVQVKNGPIDFQPREPFHPLFGAMKQTPLALELQVTQEYLGQSIHLVYLGGMWKEILDSDTYANGSPENNFACHPERSEGSRSSNDERLRSAQHDNDRSYSFTGSKGPGSTVARVVDGSLYDHPASCIISVANTGSERNWCGHHFAQANWYAFGRLAWDYNLSAEAIADEWIRMTWSNDSLVLDATKTMMLGSWESCINYMTPLGLHHIMQAGHHYGPDPAFNAAKRVDWNNVYYHRADTKGIGFDRSSTGSNAVSQYHSPLREQFNNIETCPDKFLLWFHHVPWDHRLQSGKTLWEELQHRYDAGITFVEKMRGIWQSLQTRIDPERHAHVSRRLEQQLENAHQWQEVCINYFGHFAGSEDS